MSQPLRRNCYEVPTYAPALQRAQYALFARMPMWRRWLHALLGL